METMSDPKRIDSLDAEPMWDAPSAEADCARIEKDHGGPLDETMLRNALAYLGSLRSARFHLALWERGHSRIEFSKDGLSLRGPIKFSLASVHADVAYGLGDFLSAPDQQRIIRKVESLINIAALARKVAAGDITTIGGDDAVNRLRVVNRDHDALLKALDAFDFD